MEKLVLPNISNKLHKQIATDEIPQSADGKTIMTKAFELITDYAVYAGALVLLYAIISYIFAFKSQNAEGQTNAITWLVCGAMLVSIRSVLNFIGVLN
jgi:uncharacterized membrane protein YhdT